MQTLAYLLARFSEPSSYAGLGVLLALLGFHFSDNLLGQVVQFLAGGGCGLAAVLLRDRGAIQMLTFAVLAAATLGACSGPNAPSPATIQTDAQAILTTTQQAMCEAQAAANLASAVAAGAGDASAATEASKASAAAGAGCTWVNPVVTAPAARGWRRLPPRPRASRGSPCGASVSLLWLSGLHRLARRRLSGGGDRRQVGDRQSAHRLGRQHDPRRLRRIPEGAGGRRGSGRRRAGSGERRAAKVRLVIEEYRRRGLRQPAPRAIRVVDRDLARRAGRSDRHLDRHPACAT